MLKRANCYTNQRNFFRCISFIDDFAVLPLSSPLNRRRQPPQSASSKALMSTMPVSVATLGSAAGRTLKADIAASVERYTNYKLGFLNEKPGMNSTISTDAAF